jgi:hypothetical protein
MKSFILAASLLLTSASKPAPVPCEVKFLEIIIGAVKAGHVLQIAQPNPNMFAIHSVAANETVVFQSTIYPLPDKSRFEINDLGKCTTNTVEMIIIGVAEKEKI